MNDDIKSPVEVAEEEESQGPAFVCYGQKNEETTPEQTPELEQAAQDSLPAAEDEELQPPAAEEVKIVFRGNVSPPAAEGEELQPPVAEGATVVFRGWEKEEEDPELQQAEEDPELHQALQVYFN